MTDCNFQAMGQAVIRTEADAIQALLPHVNEAFTQACQFMMNCSGRIVVVGMGKSGHIGSKIAATLASTGSPAFFVHPGEASHGDLGMITANDVVIALSNSGETAEISNIIPLIQRQGVPLIALTGNPDSTLGTQANVCLNVGVAKEACPLNLAPTSSTTAALVMGDALAVALLEAKDFTAEDFALSHPGGSLGRRLLLHVSNIMHTDDAIPTVAEDTQLSKALLEMSLKGLGMTAIKTADNKLAGIFTDGDLRRVIDQKIDLHATLIKDVMTPSPITVHGEMLAAAALEIMQRHKINAIMVVDSDNTIHGAFNMHDLLRAGVI